MASVISLWVKDGANGNCLKGVMRAGRSSVGRVLGSEAQSPGFHPQQHIACMPPHACTPTLQWWKKKNQKFKVILNYILVPGQPGLKKTL